MQDWEKKFDTVALERGKKLFYNNKVKDIQQEEDKITATLPGIQSYHVTIILRSGIPVRMQCQCPKAKGRSNCEHMAAVLYAVYGVSQEEKEQEEKKKSRAKAIRDEAVKNLQKKALEEAAAKEEAERKAAKEAAAKEEEVRKAAKEAAAKAEEERKAREEAQRRIAERNAEKAAKKAERKRRRKEAAEAAKQAALEEQRKREEEEKRVREEAEKNAALEEAQRIAEAEEKERIEKERAEKKEQKIRQAIARKMQDETERPDTETYYQRTLFDDVLKEDDTSAEDEGPSEDNEYRYFDINAIAASMKFPPENIAEGRKLRKSGNIQIDDFMTGYIEDEPAMIGEVQATGVKGKSTFPMQLLFNDSEAMYTQCKCPECRKTYYWQKRIHNCSYMAGLAEEVKSYLKDHAAGDATDFSGMELMHSFHAEHASQVIAKTEHMQEQLNLVPRIYLKSDNLYASFKTGYGKLYVIKNLHEFYEHVIKSEKAVYGKNTEIFHSVESLSPTAEKWFEFIRQAVLENGYIKNELEDAGWYYEKKAADAFLLYGWRLDRFYEILGGDSIECEDRDTAKREKVIVHTKEKNPEIRMHISKNSTIRKGEFHGVNVSCIIPPFFHGLQDSYFLEEPYLCKAQQSFVESIRILSEHAANGKLDFQIGRNNLSEFYYSLLPRLREVIDVTEDDVEEIQQYLPPEAAFLFYLDAERRNVTCRVHVKYGEKEKSVLDLLKTEMIEAYRMKNKEAEVFHIAAQLFPGVDPEQDCLHCNCDEDQIFHVMQHGVDTLMEIGEVRCTQRFRNMNVIKKVKLTAGVSVSGGLLNLDIGAEDISREELLEILKSYRLRKTYYRMKNGDFLNLEDNALEMLGELMEAMHLSPKEFVKGKMLLPGYRTLYLDKLLEENDNIYSTRDSHFREVVKSFKTVNDADYEEPGNLSEIMRSYQKKGYRWLRTLESCRFGGILADDMGLGKTLQMIAVLLAAKEEKREGTSLVVAPASLVFNWGEEFSRFAPQLNVLLVTGAQAERQRMLEDYRQYDVLVTSYDLLKRDIAVYEGRQFQYEIIDEAQYIKNHTTAVAKAVKVIHAETRFAMTGTPIENRLSELWSIFDYLMPGFLYSYEVFKREMETPIVKNRDENAMKRLQKMVAPFILRRLKGDVLKDLPDKLEEVRYVKMDSAQQTAYDAQVVHMQARLASQDDEEFSRNKIQILAELTRLRQICCDPSLCFENYKGESAKLESCLELIQNAIDGGHKLLLFSQFTMMLEILEQRLKDMGISFYVITGSTPKEKRLKMVNEFNKDTTPLFLISLKAGGVGLNLTGADVVIHYDPWWNLAVQNQATDRAHRIGQQKKVTVYKLIVKHSIEEKIQKLQEDKMDLADQIVNTQTGQLGGMSREDLLELLGI